MSAIKTRTAPALFNALRILDLLSMYPSGLTLADLVSQAEVAKSSAHYLLVTLERCGYVHRNARSGRYQLGIKLYSVANQALGSLGVRQRCASYLAGLRLRTKLTAHLAIFDRTEIVLVAKFESARGAQLASWIGKRMDMHCTGLGKAVLAYLPSEEVELILGKHGLARRNENTICTRKRLYEELNQVLKTGYAIDNEEDELGIRCMGAPILGLDGRPMAAISISGAVHELPAEEIPRLSSELLLTAKMMSRDVIDAIPKSIAPEALKSIAC
ncbi:MAG TPA: IclR family transcriptional regulator [Terracidiphilus sp.]|nr:IclR family transcriptional regulator [Terracidiphilus sp.]